MGQYMGTWLYCNTKLLLWVFHIGVFLTYMYVKYVKSIRMIFFQKVEVVHVVVFISVFIFFVLCVDYYCVCVVVVSVVGLVSWQHKTSCAFKLFWHYFWYWSCQLYLVDVIPEVDFFYFKNFRNLLTFYHERRSHQECESLLGPSDRCLFMYYYLIELIANVARTKCGSSWGKNSVRQTWHQNPASESGMWQQLSVLTDNLIYTGFNGHVWLQRG
jgi:hypothetical protein